MDATLRVMPTRLIAAIVSLAMLAGHAALPCRAAVPATEAASAGPMLVGPAQSPGRAAPVAEPKELPLVETSPLPTAAATSAVATASQPAGATPQPAAASASALPCVAPDCDHSEQMEQVARQADRQTRHGLELAGRGAYFAARAEFFASLRLIAEGLDNEQRTSAHARALAAAQLALKEAEDFLPGSPRLEADRSTADVIAKHETPVLKKGAAQATPMAAMRAYLTFAQQQLAAATGREIAGSMALRSLGKLHEALAEKKVVSEPAAQSKAMVFYQAALLAYPGNSLAANDLGVLLARCGNYSESRSVLEFSLSLCPQQATWRNLTVVYRQLGQPGLADWAGRQAVAIEQADAARRRTLAARTIRWVDPQTFANASETMPASPSGGPLMSAQAVGRPVEPGRLPPTRPAAVPTDPYGRELRTAAMPSRNVSPSQPIRRPTTAERMTWGSPYQR
ncbi:MAG: hypothetical protein ABFC96_11875 [Thermoguttaceae bacterium]